MLSYRYVAVDSDDDTDDDDDDDDSDDDGDDDSDDDGDDRQGHYHNTRHDVMMRIEQWLQCNRCLIISKH